MLGADTGKGTAADSVSPAGQFEALEKEYEAAKQAFFKAYNAAKNDEEREKLSVKYPEPKAYSRRFLNVALGNPKTPTAAQALAWVVINDRYGDDLNQALEILLRDHIESDQLGKVAQALAYSNAKEPDKTLGTILEKNPHREAKGLASYSLGLVKRMQDNDAEAEKLFEQVIEKFGDIPNYKTTLADAARGQLFELRNLGIGKVAPEIEGQDIDGKNFKLSDYRGKVVVIDFWGDW